MIYGKRRNEIRMEEVSDMIATVIFSGAIIWTIWTISRIKKELKENNAHLQGIAKTLEILMNKARMR